MMRMLAALAAIAIMFAAPAFAQERINASVGGVSIEKPQGWILFPPDVSLTNLQSFDFEDPVVQRSLAAPLILLGFESSPEIEGIMPTIEVNYIHAPELARRGAVGAVEDLYGMRRDGDPEFTVLDAPRAVTVARRSGARVRVSFSGIGNELGETDMIVIPRGDHGIFTLAFFYPSEKRAEHLATFEGVINSLRFAD